MKENFENKKSGNKINKTDSLEISSTGYGYEAVENISIENPIETKTNPSCGGL